MSEKISGGASIISENELFMRAAKIFAEIESTYGSQNIGAVVSAIGQFEIDPEQYAATLNTLPTQQRRAALQNLLWLAQTVYYLALVKHFRPGHRCSIIDEKTQAARDETITVGLAEHFLALASMSEGERAEAYRVASADCASALIGSHGWQLDLQQQLAKPTK